MPSTYAHQVFGEAVRNALPDPLRSFIDENRELFSIGLHGPDILFYYRPLVRNPVSRLGGMLHRKPGIYFFRPAAKTLARRGLLAPDLAYLSGFLCHFALDAACHGYVAEKMQASGISHAEIEGEFDRSLLVRQGKNPLAEDLIAEVHPSAENAAVIARYFPTLNRQTVLQALRSMVFYHHLLFAPHNPKRTVLYTGLKLLGQYESLHGHIISEVPNPACADSNERLWQLLEEAVPQAVALITQFPDLARGKAAWPGDYWIDFESQPAEDAAEKEEQP